MLCAKTFLPAEVCSYQAVVLDSWFRPDIRLGWASGAASVLSTLIF